MCRGGAIANISLFLNKTNIKKLEQCSMVNFNYSHDKDREWSMINETPNLWGIAGALKRRGVQIVDTTLFA